MKGMKMSRRGTPLVLAFVVLLLGVISAEAQTVTKTWTFASTAEGFAATLGANTTAAYDSGTGNPSGALYTEITGSKSTSTNYWEWTGTFEDMGVPAGAVVTQISFLGGFSRCTVYDGGSPGTSGPWELRDASGTSVLAPLAVQRSINGVEAAWQAMAAELPTTLADLPSATTVKVRLHNFLKVRNGGVAVRLYDDQVSVQITYTTANTPPSVTITAPADTSNFDEGVSINFTGTASDAEDGDLTASLAWTSSIDGSIGTGGSFSRSDLSVGTHTITASVTDSGSAVGQDQITVTVNNVTPTVTITEPAADPNGNEGQSITFTATATDPADGDISGSLAWTSDLDGSIGSGASFSFSDLSVGVHTITASVADPDGGSPGQDQVTVTVNNVAPTVTITVPAADPNATQGDSITFTATATDPVDGDISAGLSWTSDLDGPIGSGATFATTTLSVGVHTITASVADPDGGSPGEDQITVTVNPPGNTAPTVTITGPADASNFDEGVLINFTGTASDTEDGDLTASLSWTSNIDGSIGTGGTFSRNDLSVGVHTITAEATDSGALTGQDQITVTVNNVTPTVTITQPASDPNATQGDSITFTATATDPVDGDISAGLSWSSNLDGVIGSGASFATTALSVGVHTITASVADPDGGSDGQDQVTVTVNAPPANDVTPSPPTAVIDSCNQITVTVTFTGDDNTNSTTLFERSPNGVDTWTTVATCGAVGGASPRVCVDTTVLDSSINYYRTDFTDVDGVVGTDPSAAIGPYDTTLFCSVDTTTIDSNSAEATTCTLITTTSWFTGDDNGDGYTEVQFNTVNSFPGTVACAGSGGASPRQCRIPGLTESQDYWLRFHWVDPDGVAGGGAPQDEVIGPINTGACAGDGIAPTVMAIAPSRNAVIGGADTVKVQVFDSPIGSVTVVWSVDGGGTSAASVNANYDCGTNCAVYEFVLDTTSAGENLANGSHSLSIEATDSDGHVSKLGLAITVNNTGTKAAGSGLLLRRTHGSQLCIDCHNLPTHSSQHTSSKYGNWAMDCTACHTPHKTTNIYLIDGAIDTPNSGSRTVRFENKVGAVADSATAGTATYVNEDNATQADGVCQACHTRTENASGDARWRNNDAGGNIDSHYDSSGTSACTGCHTHDAGFSGAGGACDSCHFSAPTVGRHGTHDQVGTLPTSYTALASTATATQYGFACAKCHSGTHFNDNPTPHTVEVVFDATVDPQNVGGTYAAGAPETPDPGNNGDGWNWSDGTCNNLYCHSNADPLAGAGIAYQNPPPTWDQPDSASCVLCHDGGGAASDLSISHRKHSDPASYGYGCVRCHAVTVSNNTTIAEKSLHANGIKDVGFDASGMDNTGGAYDGVAHTCSDTYCHSSGVEKVPPFGSPNSIAWTFTGTCRTCHGGDATLAPPMFTKKHTSHINNPSTLGTPYECATCHDATVSSGDNEAITTFANHVNGVNDVSGVLVDATYTSPNCSESYCHSSGQAPSPPSSTSFEYYTQAWADGPPALDCKGCHGNHSTASVASTFGEPDYPNTGAGAANANSHDRHVTAAADCSSCHTTTTTNGTSILASAPHTDKVRDVVISGSWDTNGGTSNYDGITKTCNSIACHGAGTPQWGASLVCLDCHSGTEGDALGNGIPNGVADEWLTDGHGAAAGGSLGSALGGCDYCHQLDAAHTPTAGTNPYRLRFATTDNTLCLACHSTSDLGISQNSDGTGLTAENSSLNVDTAHFGAKHVSPEGGELCWDCHDPHGVPSNILMTKSQVSKTSDTYGIPGTTVAVTFTDSSTAGQAVGRFTENTNTPREGICQACHDPASGNGDETTPTGPSKYWRSDGTDDPDNTGGVASTHNAAKLCTDCHYHTDNFKGAGDDCLGCHENDSQSGTYSRRPVGADFSKNSHHVGNAGATMGGTLTNFDCVTCHLEGYVDTVADPDEVKTSDTYHGANSGLTTIDLRNSDNNNPFSYDKQAIIADIGSTPADWKSNVLGSVWNTQTSTYLDPFCLSCHDSDGAAHLTAAPNEGGGTASNPFNDGAITNEYDQWDRGGVVDVASRVVSSGSDLDQASDPRGQDGRPDPTEGIYSRHAIRGQSVSVYGGTTANWDTSTYWVGSWASNSVMGCADCHTTDGANTTDGNAHGANSEYLLKDGDGLAREGDQDPEAGDGPYNCLLCHKAAHYDDSSATHTANTSDYVDTTDLTGPGPNAGRVPESGSGGNLYGISCMNCHGGIRAHVSEPGYTTPEFGTIHGTSQIYLVGQEGGSGTRQTYRFTNGNSMRYYDPGTWTTGTGTCYTLDSKGTGGDEFGGCTKHAAGTSLTRLNRPLAY